MDILQDELRVCKVIALEVKHYVTCLDRFPPICSSRKIYLIGVYLQDHKTKEINQEENDTNSPFSVKHAKE